MIGLVLVSHSRALASALLNLVRQVSSSDAPIAIAAGVGDDRETFGTDAIEIMDAIQSVFSEEGVLVLMDLGSAVLSAQMALDLLPPEVGQKVRFCSAPLVEGAIAASVQIGLGSPIDVVANEAVQALMPKQEQLADAIPDVIPVGSTAVVEEKTAPTSSGESIELTLINPHGLHARPAAQFVRAATRFQADVQVTNLTNGKGPVTARSLNAIATLGAVENHRIQITAVGEEAAAVLQGLKSLVESGFGEAPGQAPQTASEVKATPVTSSEGTLRAVPVSDGYALAPLYCYEAALPPIPKDLTEDPAFELTRLEKALESTRLDIENRISHLAQHVRQADAAIFDAHILILQDPEMIDLARGAITDEHMNAAAAWEKTVDTVKKRYQQLDDPYQKERAVDVEDVGRQVLFTLAGKSTNLVLDTSEPVVLYAPDLSPGETFQLDMRLVQGIVTAVGGPTSHSAILARALGIPAIAGTGTFLAGIRPGIPVAINGFNGDIWIDPQPEIRKQFDENRAAWLDQRERLRKFSQEFAHTEDGKRIEVFANVGSLPDATLSVQNGAEGVGLLRTEFLFLTREEAPDEEEQYQILTQFYQILGPKRPITVRTMDIGGDKPLPYISLGKESNPFLGMRALRLSLSHPDLFLPQLRAILRAAQGSPCRIMFPMVADIDEIRKARSWLNQAHTQLSEQNIPHAWPIEAGIMIEIPSAALLSRSLAEEVDFFSIGTNDLTQYTMAAERGNPELAYLADGLHPAVLNLIHQVTEGAHAAGKWVGICGELGGDHLAIPILVGLGIDELSMNAPAIPKAKQTLRRFSLVKARGLAEQALKASSSQEVRALAQVFNDNLPVTNP